MSLSLLKIELDGFAVHNLMPSRWPTECLISWCREVAKHNAGALAPNEDDDLFEVVNSFIEKLLLAQDIERLFTYRRNSTTLFDHLAHDVDGLVTKELVARLTGFGIDRIALKELFFNHFPGALGPQTIDHQAD
jgi:hypothetical protein